MSSHIVVDYSDLEAALFWVSAGGALESRAFISKATGAIFYVSADGFADEKPPQDLDDATRYWSVPHKNDLDLGRSLALRYVDEALPGDGGTVRAYFGRRGAYSRFKELLHRHGHLDRWHEYESRATRQALLEWAAACGFRVAAAPVPPPET